MLIALFLTIVLGGGGAATLEPVRVVQILTELEAHIEGAVEDPARASHAKSLVRDNIERAERAQDDFYAARNDLLRIDAVFSSTPDDYRVASGKIMDAWTDLGKSFVEARFAMKAYITADEWEAMYDGMAPVIDGIRAELRDDE
jgi:hypothetical protein